MRMALSPGAALAAVAIICFGLYSAIVRPLFLSPLSKIPGPKLFALTKWRLALEDWRAVRTRSIDQLHRKYGPVVRVGPNEVHFNSTSALRTIYGAGSGWERTEFYRMFDVYNRQNLFTFASPKDHADRKKLLAHAYAKSSLIRGPVAESIEARIREFLDLIVSNHSHDATRKQGIEIFSALHYFSLDNITAFLYGPQFGGTRALRGYKPHQDLLNDIVDPARKQLTWFRVHFPALTIWLYTRVGLMSRLVAPFLPMNKPATYTGIRAHALRAVQDFSAASSAEKTQQQSQFSIMASLWKHHTSNTLGGTGGLSDLEIASECADHFLAGIDTTSDTLMFLIWALSLPQNKKYQERLIDEARSIPSSAFSESQEGVPSIGAADRLPYLDACVKETLRLYAPLPASEPRSLPRDAVVDGYTIPAGTVAALSPYTLHREPSVFPDPLTFNPERWLLAEDRSNEAQLTEMKKWWWAFSSGGRMCIGMHFAMAQMTLVPAIYRKYTTQVRKGTEKQAPGITSRFEIFGDDTFEKTVEHTCWIDFVEQDS
jgi:cytochrome P450